MDANIPFAGLLNSLRNLMDTGLGTIHNRVELFAVEFKEEKAQTVQLFVQLAAGLFLGMMGVIVLTGTIIFMFDAEYRRYVAGVFCVFYLSGAAVLLTKVKRRLRDPNVPFSGTINEIKKDQEWLRNPK